MTRMSRTSEPRAIKLMSIQEDIFVSGCVVVDDGGEEGDVSGRDEVGVVELIETGSVAGNGEGGD